MSEQSDGGINRSPWCAGCDHSMPDRDHSHAWIRMDGRKIGPFCTARCASGWVLEHDKRVQDYGEYETIGNGPTYYGVTGGRF